MYAKIGVKIGDKMLTYGLKLGKSVDLLPNSSRASRMAGTDRKEKTGSVPFSTDWQVVNRIIRLQSPASVRSKT